MDAVLQSPRSHLETTLSPGELECLPYPPHAIPGSRDVHSPYGVMRAYEWGPEEGAKILFVHGLSTPSPALAAIAMHMVKHGCRVILLDLWGRGYSDTPSDLPHDQRLYATQILLAVATSAVSWTGKASGGFCIVGYSMGGGIVASFASSFPQLVSSVILMAPGGLYKSLPKEYRSLPMRYPWMFPSRYVKWLIRRLLNGPLPSAGPTNSAYSSQDDARNLPIDILQTRSPLDVTGLVDWELDHHPGFVPSVINAVKHAPIEKQFATWQLLGDWLRGSERWSLGPDLCNRLRDRKVFLLLGDGDSILDGDYLRVKATQLLGANHIEIAVFEGGHDFPIRRSIEVASRMCSFLEL